MNDWDIRYWRNKRDKDYQLVFITLILKPGKAFKWQLDRSIDKHFIERDEALGDLHSLLIYVGT